MAEKPHYSNIDEVLFLTCRYHQGKQLDLYCRQCEDLVCTECSSRRHNDHSVCELVDIIPERKQDIENLIERTEKYQLIQIREYITSTETQLIENDSYFEKLSSDLTTQTNKLKDDLDFLVAQTHSTFSQMKEDNAGLLQTYKQDLEIYETQLQRQMQECKTILHRDIDVEIYHCGCKARYDDIIPVKPTLRTASFTLNANYLADLKQALGDVVIEEEQTSDDSKLPTGSPSDQLQQVTRKLDESESATSSYSGQSKLLPQGEVMQEFKSPRMISAACHTNDGQVWVSYFNSGSLALLDRKGLVNSILRCGVSIKDISISPTTDALWICHTKDRNIKELVSGNLVRRFKTTEEPLCICVTASSHVIVGMAKNISKFTTTGKVVLSTKVPKVKKTLVCSPLKVSECPVTYHVAVIDEYSKAHGGEGRHNVVVMNNDFQELFRYRGEIPATYQQTPKSESDVFVCYGIGFDRQGNLVIGDHKNNRILLLGGDGHFLRVLHVGKRSPWALSVNRENVVFAVFNGDWVKLLKYNKNYYQLAESNV